MALAGPYAGKRAACIFSAGGVYEALDPLMSSAYTGVKGGFVILCVKEGDLDVTPLGPFSKLPVLVSDGAASQLGETLRFAFDLSERHEIPCIVETLPPEDAKRPADVAVPDETVSRFVKDPSRWAATPKFRYELHGALNKKVERIREEFETYEGNEQVPGGNRGVITHRACRNGHWHADTGVLNLGSVFPLPRKLVSAFIARTEEVQIAEGPYPAIEIQIAQKERIVGRLDRGTSRIQSSPPSKNGETLFGLKVVRDTLGPASSINIAHGMVTSGAQAEVLALTDEQAFFHSGLPAFVNTLYNGSSYLLVIKTLGAAEELKRSLEGFGFRNYFYIANIGEIERYKESGELTVLLYEGDL